MVKVIAFTGAQGTGKTTMREKLARALEERGFKVFSGYHGVGESSISREASKLGFKINKDGNFISQYYMSVQYAAKDMETRLIADIEKYDYVLVDRSIIDVLPYSKQCVAVNEAEYEFIKEEVDRYLTLLRPELIIWCKPLDVLIGDDKRLDDKDYQDEIHGLYVKIMEEYKIRFRENEIMELEKDTIENRLEKIMEVVIN